MKENKFILVITTIVCLLPIILALVIYDDLPDQVAMQYNLEGNANWYAPKAVASFGMPLSFAVFNIIALALLFNDPKRKNVPKKLLSIVQWIIPLASLLTVPLILFSAMGIELPIIIIVFSFVGLIFILIGNYLPKCKQNNRVGIKITWTLNDTENWNKTHRLAGFLFIIGGIIFIIFGFLPLENQIWVIPFISIIILLNLIPFLYSYLLYKRSLK